MIRWRKFGSDNPWHESECGLYVIYRSTKGDIIAKRYAERGDVKPVEVSGPLASVGDAKAWCEDTVPVFTL